MKRWTPAAALAIVAAVVMAVSAPAAAKGADQATITGPGLAKPIVLTGVGEPGSANSLGLLSEGSGLFAAMYGSDGSGPQLTGRQPTEALGPKYQIAYRVPGGDPEPDIVKQDLYPFADGGAVTFTAPGQASFGGTTHGGWFRAPASFLDVLTAIGVPDRTGASVAAAPVPSNSPTAAAVAAAPRVEHSSDRTSTFVAVGVIAAAAAIALAMLALRRRPGNRQA